MNFLAEHMFEILIAIEIGVTVWVLKEVMAMKIATAIMQSRIDHINRAVNNVGADDKSMRVLVEETGREVLHLKNKIDILEERTKQRYE